MLLRSFIIAAVAFLPAASAAERAGLDVSSASVRRRMPANSHINATRGPSIPVTVVVMDSFGDARLLGAVRRTTGPARADLIVIKRSSMTPELLEVA